VNSVARSFDIETPRLLLVAIAIAVSVAIVAGPINLSWSRPGGAPSYVWTNIATPIAATWLFVGLLWFRLGWARWLLVAALVLFAITTFGRTQKSGAASLFTMLETARGVAFLALAFLIFRSQRLRGYVSAESFPDEGDDDQPSGARSARPSTAAHLKTPMSRLIVAGAVLSWLWVLAYARVAISLVIDYATDQQSVITIMVPSGRFALVSATALVLSSLSALAFSVRLPALRLCCVLAPALSFLLASITPLMGPMAQWMNIAIFIIAIVSWRRLGRGAS
jgi:hypothetical protein